MNAAQYPSLNVLIVSRGFDDPQFKYKINPLRIEKPDGRVFKVKEVRLYTTKKVGWSFFHHYFISIQDEY